MTLKKHIWSNNIEACITCMFIDEYVLNVSELGKVPHGYDGTAFCCKWDDEQEESNDNRFMVSPSWVACSQYKRCTERQANYLDIFDRETQTIIENPNDISMINVDN